MVHSSHDRSFVGGHQQRGCRQSRNGHPRCQSNLSSRWTASPDTLGGLPWAGVEIETVAGMCLCRIVLVLPDPAWCQHAPMTMNSTKTAHVQHEYKSAASGFSWLAKNNSPTFQTLCSCRPQAATACRTQPWNHEIQWSWFCRRIFEWMKRCDKVGGEVRHSRGEWLTYQEFPKVFEPFFSASRSSCAALNYGKSCVSLQVHVFQR